MLLYGTVVVASIV